MARAGHVPPGQNEGTRQMIFSSTLTGEAELNCLSFDLHSQVAHCGSFLSWHRGRLWMNACKRVVRNFRSLWTGDPTEKKNNLKLQEETRDHFLTTVKVNEVSLRWRLSWLDNHLPLKNNYDLATKRLDSKVKRLKDEWHRLCWTGVFFLNSTRIPEGIDLPIGLYCVLLYSFEAVYIIDDRYFSASISSLC
ncbi:hypothetical protein HNY73_001593 [Argiope bruennichi]|uniref:Uncharacterized protein n=1 Tax=Argiope bruennichi TaxID=94029 RepID=A0A8T0G7P9_ARGBR|nr:hypothetical protein HNY73_001593 [Argiope bruennichi]